MDDLLNEFLMETAESMAALDTELVRFERNPNDQEILSNIFRLVHTIKGTCGFLGLPRLEAVAHASENVLGRIRDGGLNVTPGAVSLILDSLDRIKSILDGLEATETEPGGDDTDLIRQLNHLAETGEVPGGDDAETGAPTSQGLDNSLSAMQAADTKMVPAGRDTPEMAGGPPATAMGAPPATPIGDDGQPLQIKAGAGVTQTIRVNVDLLENLMVMVSELVLTRNQLLQILRSQDDSDFNTPLQRLSHVTSELQEGVMKARMQPIGNAWSKLPRIVRDLSLELGKKIDLHMIGAETELDRQVLEIIKDPLTHMVRNSADHGIETVEDRIALGKPETGTITLNACHEGGFILIEISDDGKGLSAQAIKAKAIASGLAPASELESMSEHQLQQLIFAAGFSTATEVTTISGRGVGLDVVKSNIDRIGGTVEMTSTEGKGTAFTVRIPLTLAIVPALIVECGTERFAIPRISVVELVRASADAGNKIEDIHGAPVLRLRDRLLPLINLRKLLDMEDADDPAGPDEAYIVVIHAGAYTFGIIVDKINDVEEIVVKPVSALLRQIPIFAGNTILGDGSVIMILDPNGIAQTTGEMQAADQLAVEPPAPPKEEDGQRVALLLFRADGRQPKAVPLALISRLEEIDLETVEHSDGQAMVQYRGSLMPLIPINPDIPLPQTGKKPTLVFSDRSRSMGLIVDEVLDIVEDRLVIEHGARKPGLVGSAIIAGKATEVIDTAHYLTTAFPDWFGREKGSAPIAGPPDRKKRVLLVDDSAFFRNLLTPFLSVAGYSVSSVDSAAAVLKLYERGEEYDGIVSDIEMPGMNGFELVERLRSGGRWEHIPIVALSSHTSDADHERGNSAGFTDLVAKHDRDGLLQALAKSLDTGYAG